MKIAMVVVAIAMGVLFAAEAMAGGYIGKYSKNPYGVDSTSNPASRYNSNSVRNPYGRYGSRYSPNSANNPYTTSAPRMYDQSGNYRGRLSNNPYDADSTANPYGRYGSPYSADSVNNPYGAGNQYRTDSPNNPYGQGWDLYGDD